MRIKTYTLGKRLGYLDKINCNFYKTKKDIVAMTELSMYELNNYHLYPRHNAYFEYTLEQILADYSLPQYYFVEVKEGEYHGKKPISNEDKVFPLGKYYGESIIECEDYAYLKWILDKENFTHSILQEIVRETFDYNILKHNAAIQKN